MRSWENYKSTFKKESLGDLARKGDVSSLLDYAKSREFNPVEINLKNSQGYSPLMLAVYNDQIAFAEALLILGAEVNSADYSGNTVLMAAAFKGNLQALELLIKHGADSKLENHSGMTAMSWAKSFGRKSAVKYLKKNTVLCEESYFSSYLGFAKMLWRKIIEKTEINNIKENRV